MIEAYEYKQRNKRVIQLTIDSVPNYFIPSFDDVDSDLNKCQRFVHVLNECNRESLVLKIHHHTFW